MPPKASSAAWPRRSTPRATARKSTPTARVAVASSAAKVKSTIVDASPPPPPPSETTPPSALTSLTSPPPAAAAAAEQQGKSPPSKTTPTRKSEAAPVSAVPDDDDDATTTTKTKTNTMMTKTDSESESALVPQNDDHETLLDKDEKASGIDNANANAKVGEGCQESGFREPAAATTTKKTGARRTVVKKTVRVVKKVVKKKKMVPKTKMLQKAQAQAAVSSSTIQEEEVQLADPDDNEREIPPSVVLLFGAMEEPNNSSPVSDSSVSVEVENQNPNSDFSVSLEAAQGPNSDPHSTSSIPEVVMAGVENGLISSTNSTVPGSIQVENPEAEAEAAAGKENVESGGGEEGEEGVNNFDLGDLKGEAGMGDGVVMLSGEMEALERRKRRKTEIFIGGLDKDAKEEDIRKVFQEVGEIVDVRLMMNDKTGKNKGFAFVRYASAADAKKALTKLARVEICGKQCGAAPVEGNDTIFLGNIDKNWKSEDIVKLLQEIGIEKIDKVTVVANPSNIECNRGFAFLELETSRDAQNAYRKLQKKDIFGKHQKIKVAWAEPLIEPDQEEMLKVKSVYAEYLPSSWDEEKVKDYFKKFGEIENVVLARNLPSSRRKDFAFVNYTTREAALACIEAFNRESLNDEASKVNLKVSLAKPMPKGKQVKRVSNPVSKEPPKLKRKAAQSVIKLHQPTNKGKSASSNYDDIRVNRRTSTTAELVQLLREQASSRQPQTGFGTGSADLDYHYSPPTRKRPFFLLGDDTLYSASRGYPRTRFESSFLAASPSGLSQGLDMTSFPCYPRQGAGYAPGSLYGAGDYPNSLQTRGAPYHGSSGINRRY